MRDFAEVVLATAEAEFRHSFESELRQRLLDQATAEIELIVRAVSDKVVTHTQLCVDHRSMTYPVTMSVKVVK